MEQLSTNLKYLRLRKRLSQPKLGANIQLNASTISAYEKGRSIPRLQNLLKLSGFFNRNIDEILHTNLEEQERQKMADTKGEKLRILPIVVDGQNEEMITLVPVKAAAGYLEGYSDAEFIGDLPNFRLPFAELSENKTYRAFQIQGNSMLPIPSGAYIICEFLQDWEQIKNATPYIVITQDDGIVYKRVEKNLKENQLILHSDNKEFMPFEVSINQVLEVWKALGYVCFNLP